MGDYSLTAAERELQISMCDDEDMLCITSSSPYWTRRILKAADSAGAEVKRIHNDETIRVYLPKRYLVIKAPRQMSEEQKAAASERLKTARATSVK